MHLQVKYQDYTQIAARSFKVSGPFMIFTLFYRYNPIQNSWQKLADMNERRCNFALVVLDGKMFAIGGDNDSEVSIGSVEVYSPITDYWR